MDDRDRTEFLLHAAREGDQESFDELDALYRRRVDALVRARLGEALKGALEVEDVVQETFLRAFRSLRDFEWQGEESFFWWLASISTHVMQEQARRHRLRAASALDSRVAADDLSQSTVQRREERFDRLKQAVEALSPDHRQVVLLARIDRLPIKEVARRMQRSRLAVRQLLWRALQELRAIFGETESFHLPPRSLQEGEGHDGGS